MEDPVERDDGQLASYILGCWFIAVCCLCFSQSVSQLCVMKWFAGLVLALAPQLSAAELLSELSFAPPFADVDNGGQR